MCHAMSCRTVGRELAPSDNLCAFHYSRLNLAVDGGRLLALVLRGNSGCGWMFWFSCRRSVFRIDLPKDGRLTISRCWQRAVPTVARSHEGACCPNNVARQEIRLRGLRENSVFVRFRLGFVRQGAVRPHQATHQGRFGFWTFLSRQGGQATSIICNLAEGRS